MPHPYYIDKRSGTSADTLLAAGFARLAQMVLQAAGAPSIGITLVDCGDSYRVDLPRRIEEAALQHIEALPFVQHLDTDSQKTKLGAHYGYGFDYDREREKRAQYRERRKALPPAARRRDAILRNDPDLEALIPYAPDPLLPLYLVINQMKVASSFNEAVIRWRELTPALLRDHVRLLLDLFSTQPNQMDQLSAACARLAKQHRLGSSEMTMLQVVNPTTGKGANRTKANDLTVGGQNKIWLLELLKFAGFFALGHPQVISGSKDRKTYVLRPRTITLDTLDDVVRTFRALHWSNTPAKLDVLAALDLTRVLVNSERRALQKEQGDQRRRGPRPADRVQGLDVTFYKDMGSAFAVLNVATINVPEWVPEIVSVAQADRVLDVLSEHVAVISSIRAKDGEERSEEYELLRRYRDFLSGHDIEPFLDFATLFAPYLSRKIERGEYIQPFRTETLEELIRMTKHDFVRVIESEGFQNVAAAIRRSTLLLQIENGNYKQGRGPQPQFQIRYGLAQELVRAANDTDGFIAALSSFITSYNNESTRKFEITEGRIERERLEDTDIAEIIRLLSEGYSPKTLARLLVAFGSAEAKGEPVAPILDPPSEDLEGDTDDK